MSVTVATLGAQLGFLVAMMLAARLVAEQTQQRRDRREAKRLRVILAVGLRDMRDLYADNLRSLERGKRLLLSGRHRVQLVRTYLGRLSALDEGGEIETVLAANSAIEAAEAAMTIGGKPMHGVAYALRPEVDTRFIEFALSKACAALEQAATMLDQSACQPAAEGLRRRLAQSFARPAAAGVPEPGRDADQLANRPAIAA